MKKLNKYGLGIAVMAVSLTSLTGCIDETSPTNSVTQEQVTGSSTAAEQAFYGITAQANANYFSSRRDWDYGYASLMHIRDVQTQDMATADPSGYNQYYYWGINSYMGRDYVFAQWQWNYQYKFVNTTNIVISSVDEETANDTQKGYLGAAYAFRALIYLDIAREYEYLANDGTSSVNSDGNDVSGLTAPIIKENMSEAETRSNPRATRQEMYEFILSDLQNAEKNIGYMTSSDHTIPHLDVVYGLYARLYMWVEDYANAEAYARKAIDEATTDPMTQAECTDATTGFNDITKWMLGSTVAKEALISNLQNWAAFVCNEATFGYAGGGGCNIMLDKSMYDRLSNTDWRKLMYKAPEGSTLYGKNTYIDAEVGAGLEDYASLKFRPASGELENSDVGAATSYPMMRVEEMYFIEAEAAAHQDAARGKSLLESFMKTYRDTKYSTTASSQEAIIDEIVFQKRIELWGEGQSFFDVKRLNIPCTRGYSGTNHLDIECLNTTTRPAWMNWVMVESEENGNTALKGYNNPDPSDAYTPWTGQ